MPLLSFAHFFAPSTAARRVSAIALVSARVELAFCSEAVLRCYLVQHRIDIVRVESALFDGLTFNKVSETTEHVGHILRSCFLHGATPCLPRRRDGLVVSVFDIIGVVPIVIVIVVAVQRTVRAGVGLRRVLKAAIINIAAAIADLTTLRTTVRHRLLLSFHGGETGTQALYYGDEL